MDVLLADVEGNDLYPAVSKLWCICIGTPDSDEVDTYADQPGYKPISEAISRMSKADRVVFHNGIGYDLPTINKLYPDTLSLEQIYDTLVVARLSNPQEKENSLAAFGERLGFPKGEWTDFSRWHPDMATYCSRDVRVMRRVYKQVHEATKDWGISVELEHRFAYVIWLQEQNGFQLNLDKARALEAELRQELVDIERELQSVFPPMWVPDCKEPFVPKRPNKRAGYTAGCPLTKVKLQEFNPGSRQQIADRLQKARNWKPTKFTPTGGPQIDETVLAELRFPEAEVLSRYFRISKQLGQLADGDNAWLKLVHPNGRVYGRVNTNGAATGRCSHFKPNMAQVDKKDLRMREVWEPQPGWKLVGCDAEGLEARMLGHYLARYDSGEFSDRVVNGDKSQGTDVHTVNQKAINLPSRDGAKTFLYALMYGAGDAKLGRTIIDAYRDAGKTPPKGSPTALGKKGKQRIADGMRGIDRLIGAVKKKAQSQGYIVGLDGRHIFIKSEHSAFNFLLQGGGAIVMKMALVIFHFELRPENNLEVNKDFNYCANVHDEAQLEVVPEKAELVGQLFSKAIQLAGERLKIRCPLAGAYEVGDNWAETH